MSGYREYLVAYFDRWHSYRVARTTDLSHFMFVLSHTQSTSDVLTISYRDIPAWDNLPREDWPDGDRP